MCRIAMLSVHTCPLATLGGKETGGMNVYVRELTRELGRRGKQVDVFTRAVDPSIAAVRHMGPNARVIHIPAGPLGPYDKNAIYGHLPEFMAGIEAFRRKEGLR
ncbi:MAG TPA: glycosyltransferase, partial [Chloroflexia bacterium]|nr:glycosyltransferase [Chloroflexia bacterium]